ncbi:ABC-type multidrug transport system ATPase subunit/peptidoglycan/LPS O-acetylase OafA/YrhL [Pelomonas saccharophila]|uniref:ABC-type multidrug transport system ATPase subunit/peptidoglycan/LPS O-acetylase OafA/YrhL n=1 Tax=Roseateles saccharophilus TaxID=304 RepID=A0ABU1YMQ0_ROSSA|nr:ATP-binding cassette domain-containing protein [Roseateles saccharophilus]MDR7270137.1 ABC-type multidrug transport system ATPase subunit/peptidoglycan/LPS O-acetylase OafA/YrhL [Roseateles saccharophilus]
MTNQPNGERLHALDAVRSFALLLGVAFHAMLSFIPGMPPGLWAMVDNSPSPFLADVSFVAHSFRMTLFFFIAGFFARGLHQRLGTGGFWANRGKRIAVPMVVGWLLSFPAIILVWTLGAMKLFHGAPPAPPEMPKAIGALPLFHLWFLYQLLWLYAGTLIARSVIAKLDSHQAWRGLVDRTVTAALRWPAGALLLGLPLAACLLALPRWMPWAGIPTPDQSLIPQLPATVGYGLAFAFGWLVQRAPDALAALRSRWSMHLTLAIASSAVCLYVLKTQPVFGMPDNPKLIFTLSFVASSWAWSFAITGLALRHLSGHRPAVRYVADASYWIYLVHLPVVAALQVWVGDWPLHWSLKYPFIVGVSLGLLLLSYHYLVRSTVIGRLLNGRIYPRHAAAAPVEIPADDELVASLRGVSKRYGKLQALSSVDLQLKRGELLALLGPNGAGKSTAISLWLGLHEADAGVVRLLGGAPQQIERRRGLGVMMQDIELPKDLKVHELVALSASYYERPMTVKQALERAGIEALAQRPYGKLSGGQKRQVQFALAICGRPRVLFLDEPTVGLDLQAREAMWAHIRALLREGCSILLTTHYLEEAEALATRVAVLGKGRLIASGSVDEMRALVSRRHIRCDTTLPPLEVRRWAGVVEVSCDHDQLAIVATDAEAVVRRLLAADPQLSRLEVKQAGLNEAFNELTREAA